MATGYYFAIAKGGMETMSNALLAVVLVVIGVYFYLWLDSNLFINLY